jgi:AcrR family transcriptional regulator
MARRSPPRPKRRKSGPVPREQTKQETREALIQSALDAFAREGLEAPSLDAICEKAGYTRGAFYVHFRDRDDLVAAVMQRVTGVLLDTLIATGNAALDLERTVRSFADAVAAGAYPLPGSVSSQQILHACARSERIRQRYVATLSEAVKRVSRAVGTGQRAGSVRADVPAAEVANLLVALVLAVQTLREVDFPFDVRRSSETLLRLLEPPKG